MGAIGDRFVDPDNPAVECLVVWSGGPLIRPSAVLLYGDSSLHEVQGRKSARASSSRPTRTPLAYSIGDQALGSRG